MARHGSRRDLGRQARGRAGHHAGVGGIAAPLGAGDFNPARASRRGLYMETKVNYTIVGVFVLLLGGALLGVAFWLSAGGQFQRDQQRYHAYLTSRLRASNNAPVRYRGWKWDAWSRSPWRPIKAVVCRCS